VARASIEEPGTVITLPSRLFAWTSLTPLRMEANPRMGEVAASDDPEPTNWRLFMDAGKNTYGDFIRV